MALVQTRLKRRLPIFFTCDRKRAKLGVIKKVCSVKHQNDILATTSKPRSITTTLISRCDGRLAAFVRGNSDTNLILRISMWQATKIESKKSSMTQKYVVGFKNCSLSNNKANYDVSRHAICLISFLSMIKLNAPVSVLQRQIAGTKP